MSSPIPSVPYASPAGGGAIPNVGQSLPGENFHPTVRVMRLYKPGFHMSSTTPLFPPTETETFGSDFTLSSHMLLPDSFGDIYLGEKFTAYVAIVNGFPQVPFHNVSLSVRLQTETTVVELQDTRPTNQILNQQHKTSVFPILNHNDSCDVLIQHVLNELGTHTLRVSVQYSLFPGGEIKSMRKFYRFNVLLPLVLLSSFREIDHKPMVQCQITNSTKSPVFIEEITFVPANKYTEFITIGKEETEAAKQAMDASHPSLAKYDEPLQLLPDESLAFAFQFTKYDDLVGRIAGYPLIRWCSSMGESSLFRGDDTLIRATQIPTALLTQPIKFMLDTCPATVDVAPSSSASAVPHRGLFYVETTAMDLGNLEGGDFTDIVLTVYAASPGVYELPPIYAIHAVTKEKYLSGRLASILVRHPSEETREGEEVVEVADLVDLQ
eukprot:gene3038-2223_t